VDNLPDSWIALASLVFVLGMRHGLDADHLVAIDGLTRFNAASDPRLARWCGTLFSLGHGAIVMTIALVVGALTTGIAPPRWLEDVGAWVSIGFLIALGVLNAVAVARTHRGKPVRLIGVKTSFAAALGSANRPLLVASVGSLFALSFDTLTQAALFALAAAQYGGIGHALTLGALFTIGMILVDGFNGIWIYRLIRRTSERALIASRVFALLVSLLSLAVAAFGIAKYFSPVVTRWSENKELAMGIGVIALVILGFVASMGASRIRIKSSSD